MQSIRQTLDTLHEQRLSLGKDHSVSECITTIGTISSPASQTWCGILIDSLSFSLDCNTAACKRLLRRRFAPEELPSLVDAILSSKNESEMIFCLSMGDAQRLIEVIDEVRSTAACHRLCLLKFTSARHSLCPNLRL